MHLILSDLAGKRILSMEHNHGQLCQAVVWQTRAGTKDRSGLQWPFQIICWSLKLNCPFLMVQAKQRAAWFDRRNRKALVSLLHFMPWLCAKHVQNANASDRSSPRGEWKHLACRQGTGCLWSPERPSKTYNSMAGSTRWFCLGWSMVSRFGGAGRSGLDHQFCHCGTGWLWISDFNSLNPYFFSCKLETIMPNFTQFKWGLN